MKNILKMILVISIFTNVSVYAMQEQNENIKHKQQLFMANGYEAILSSETPLIDGKNTLNIIITKDKNYVRKADVNIIFALLTIPNMEFSEHAIEDGDKYSLTANFKKRGEWKYELMFKTIHGAIYSQAGRVTIN